MRSVVCIAIGALALASCGESPALLRVMEARQRAASMLVQFTKASDATNRAVMADTDESSAAFAAEAGQARESVQREVDALGPLLQGLDFAEEGRLLQDFVTQFQSYRDLDQSILALAVENTNLKAQKLSFGPAAEAADAIRDALESVGTTGPHEWQVRAWTASTMASVREIQALAAPHIAEPEDESMTRLEQRMRDAESHARRALASLQRLTARSAASRVAVDGAVAAFERFVELNQQIVALSRRNTNVRSLALSLNEKGKLTVQCEQSLHALVDALGARMSAGGR